MYPSPTVGIHWCEQAASAGHPREVESAIKLHVLGYEPADLTVHPPQNCRGWVYFFRIGV